MVAEATGALEWLEEKQKLQNSLRSTDDPVLMASDIAKREGTLVRFADPILNKPAPPPPKVISWYPYPLPGLDQAGRKA